MAKEIIKTQTLGNRLGKRLRGYLEVFARSAPDSEMPPEALVEQITNLNLLTDDAIGESNCSREDGLGFKPYAQILGDAAAGTQGPFVIGIFGEWGTGKTSLMHLIDSYLEKNHSDTIRVWVNAWRFEREEHPIIPLIKTIIREINKKKSRSKKAREVADSLSRLLRAVLYGSSFKSKLALPGGTGLEGGFSFKDAIDRYKDLKTKLDRSLYYDAYESLSSIDLKGVRIVIIIDDLDRCLPDMAINILESIKLVFAQEGFIFIFGAARSVIEGYLQHRYEKKYGLTAFAGNFYLDKIVQLPFSIPPHGGRIKSFSESILGGLNDSYQNALKDILPIICTVSAGNPRTTIRFINNLIIDQAINRSLAKQEQRKEIPIGFFAITRSLQQRWPAMFEVLIKRADFRNWIISSKKEEIQNELPADTDVLKVEIQYQMKTDIDFNELIFSDAGLDWLKEDDLRKAAIEFLMTERPGTNEPLPDANLAYKKPPGPRSSQYDKKARGGRRVFISTTGRDLAAHLNEVVEACLRQDMDPVTTEASPTNNSTDASLEAIDESDLYLGILGFRYGYVPPGHENSLFEIEYNRAVERGIPRMIFLMDKTHPITQDDIETNEGAAKKLTLFKERLTANNMVKFFSSPDDLRLSAISSLVEFNRSVQKGYPGKNIPARRDAYIAHPYSLLQTDRLVGRRRELNLLTEWVARSNSDIYQARILCIVAVGGIGKSALIWKWFNEMAPREMIPVAGRMWWSFYESDGYFENFIVHALAYVSNSSIDEIDQIPVLDRETRLLAILNQEPFLLVLDGLERVLIAYQRTGAARMQDTEAVNHKNYRKTVDPRVGQFLKKLAQVERSRILVSTRLQPADLETETGEPLPGVFRYDLESLSDDDAVDLWHKLGVRGSRDVLLPIFRQFGKHTLLIQALAGEIVNYRRAPGDFEKWREANPRFDPTKYIDLKDRMNHVLEFALKGLVTKARNILNTMAAFRMPTSYETLAALFIGTNKLYSNEGELDEVMTELEDRGLIGWDKRTNRYGLHPIVRGVIWGSLDDKIKQDIYNSLYTHFENVPTPDEGQVVGLEGLAPTIELYNILVGMERFEEAYTVFKDRLNGALFYRLGAGQQRVELLEMLFPDGLDHIPRLAGQDDQIFALNALASGYQLSGQPGLAIPLLRRSNKMNSQKRGNNSLNYANLINLSSTLRLTGHLHESEKYAGEVLAVSRTLNNPADRQVGLFTYHFLLAMRGHSAGLLSQQDFVEGGYSSFRGLINIYCAQTALWLGDYGKALQFGDLAESVAQNTRIERDFIGTARVQGEASLWLDDLYKADERLSYALSRARAVNYVEEELPTLTALTELRRRQGDIKAAREFLDDVWEYAERGPYPLFHADALNVLAQIERDVGNTDKAIEAATKAYQLAWCDGPPYAYHWGLVKAQKHLEELGAPLPDMPPFDESKYEPMPEVEIDPEDEFHVGDSLPS